MHREWYKKLGFAKNPLSSTPRFSDPLCGYDLFLEEMYYRIDSGSFIFLEGEVGKTATLMKIIQKYKGNKKLVYVDLETIDRQPNIKDLLAGGKKATLFSDIVRKVQQKEIILLLDNVTEVTKKTCFLLQHYFDEGTLLSVVLAGNKEKEVRMPQSLLHRIGKRIYKLRSVSPSEISLLIEKRLGDTAYIMKKQIEENITKEMNVKEAFAFVEDMLILMLIAEKRVVDDEVIKKAKERRKKGGKKHALV